MDGSRKQEIPPIGRAVQNATTLIPERLSSVVLAVTCSENVYARPCIYSLMRLERDDNTTIAIYVIDRRPQVHSSPVFGVKKQKCIMNKVITTVVIRLLDDHTYCAQFAYTNLGLW